MSDPTQVLIDQAVEKLKKAQAEQFQNLEPALLDNLKKGLGVAELTQSFEKANGEVAKLTAEIETLTAKQAEEKLALNERLDKAEAMFSAPDSTARGASNLGGRFVKAVGDEAAWKAAENAGKTGKIALSAGDYIGARKDISGDSASAGALQDTLRVPGVISEPNTALSVQDLLPQTRTSSRTVDWVRELLLTDETAVVAENETVYDAVEKPKSNITFQAVSETMKTIATWVAASKQILRYSNRTQLQNYIDGRLRYMVQLELEDQILLGDNTNENFNGLVAQAQAYNRGYDQIQSADPTIIDTLRRAITQARLAEYPVTGMVLHPTEVEKMTLLKGSDLHYIWAMPGQASTIRPWGVALAESTRMTEGEFLVGAFSLGAELFIGEEISVEATRYHEDFFTKNLVAILAEMDALLAVYRPQAFVTGGFEATTT